MGAVDYVFKPVEPIVLRSKVAVFVDLFADDPGDPAQGARRSRRCSTPICAPMPSGCGPSRSCASPSSARRRSSSRCRSSSISSRSSADPRVPAIRQRQFRSASPASPSTQVRGQPDLWAERLHPEDRERVARGARASASAPGAMAIEYRWQCADGQLQAFPRPGGAARATRDGDAARICRHPARRHRPQAAREAAAPGAQDGRDRQADRRHRARFQQSARRGARRPRPDRAPAAARRGASEDPRA